jgi:hypothetical protein
MQDNCLAKSMEHKTFFIRFEAGGLDVKLFHPIWMVVFHNKQRQEYITSGG